MAPTFVEISKSLLTPLTSLCPSFKIAPASRTTLQTSKWPSHLSLPLPCFGSVISVVWPPWMLLHSGQGVAVGPSSTLLVMSSGPSCCSMTRPFDGPMQMRSEASDWVESVSCHAWRPGYCMVNGTLIPLTSKPGHFGEQFFDHKSNYSQSLMVSSIHHTWFIQLISPPAHYSAESSHYQLCAWPSW